MTEDVDAIVSAPAILNQEDTRMRSIAQSPDDDKNEGGEDTDTCGQVWTTYFCDCFYFICGG